VLHILRRELSSDTDGMEMIEDTDSAKKYLIELGDFVLLDPFFLRSCEAASVRIFANAK